jgi:hypothetical protein
MPPKEEGQKKVEDHKPNIKLILATIAIIVGWFSTIVGLVWTASSKDTQYEFRIRSIEKELVNLDERMDAAESFRMEIRSDLAEIKTDLVWIRKELEKN